MAHTKLASILICKVYQDYLTENMEPESGAFTDLEHTCPDSACWICLEPHTADNPLAKPCSCPRKCHLSCLSRWQLQSAGKTEETTCRFCHDNLPHWSASLAEQAPAKQTKDPSHIIMGIRFKNKTYKVKFEEGVVGAEKFKQEVRRVLQLPASVDIDANFIVSHPQTGERLTLSGFRTYEAAAQLAAMNAAKRCSRSDTMRSHSSSRNAEHRSAAPLAKRIAHAFKQLLNAGSRCYGWTAAA